MGTQLATETTPQARGDDAPDPQPSSARPVHPTAPAFQLLRKLLRLGNSYAVTIPTAWVNAHVNPRLPYLTTNPNPDGSITLRAFDPNKSSPPR